MTNGANTSPSNKEFAALADAVVDFLRKERGVPAYQIPGICLVTAMVLYRALIDVACKGPIEEKRKLMGNFRKAFFRALEGTMDAAIRMSQPERSNVRLAESTGRDQE